MDTSGLGSIPSASVTGQLPTRASEPHVSYSADGDDHEQLARDPLDDILDQYQFHWVPEYRLKLKKELASFGLAACLAKPHERTWSMRLTVKPTEATPMAGSLVQKVLLVPQKHVVALYSRKLPLSIFRLQGVVGYNWQRKQLTLDYRLNTKWSDGLRFKRKERYQLHDNLLVRCKWNLDMMLPDVEGHLGNLDDSPLPTMDVEYGRLDFDVNQIDAVLDLDGTQTYQARSREGMNDTVKNSAAVGGVLDNKSRSTSNSIDKLSLRTVRWAKALVGKAKGSEQAEPTVDLHKVAPSAGVSAPVSVSARSPFAGMDEWWRQLAANVQQGKWAAGGQL